MMKSPGALKYGYKVRPVFIRLLVFFAIVFIKGWSPLKAQALFDNVTDNLADGNDSLINAYLKDTVNSAQRIKQLVKLARQDRTNGNESSAINKFQLALSLEPYAKDSFEVISTLHGHFASLLVDGGNTDLAIDYAKSALFHYKRAFPYYTDHAYNLIGRIATLYLNQHSYDSALNYYRLSLKEAEGVSNPIWVCAAYNNLGILYLEKGNLALARSNFDTALSKHNFHIHGDSVLFASIQDNLGLLMIKNGEDTKALALFRVNEQFYRSMNGYSGVLKTLGRIPPILMNIGKMQEAWAAIQVYESFAEQHQLNHYANNRVMIAQFRKEYFQKTGNPAEALKCQEVISSIKDSLNNRSRSVINSAQKALINSQISKFRSDIRVNRLKLSENEKDLQNARREARMGKIMIALIVAIVILLVIYFFNRGRIQKNQLKLQEAESRLMEKSLHLQQLEREKLEQELKYKKGDLNDLSLYLSKLKDIYATLPEKLNEIKDKKPLEQRTHINVLIKEIEAQVHSGEKLGMIQENLDQVNKEFYDKLIKPYPGLTKSELELCGLLRLNMSNKEIAALKNISAESVKMARHRLRQKLALSPEVDIYRFLAGI